MGDFYLDFRPTELRKSAVLKAAELLRFCDDTRIRIFERDKFSLVLTSVDQPELWDSFESQDGNFLVGAIGRPAFDAPQWHNGQRLPGSGGLSNKIILDQFEQEGPDALKRLNGHFAVFIFDAKKQTARLASDRFGMCIVYGLDQDSPSVFSSHPDVLAALTGQSSDLDRTSMAEFLMTGRVTFPNSYYSRIKALGTGSLHTFDLSRDGTPARKSEQFFKFDFQIDSEVGEPELADRLAVAFQKAVRRRTLPLFGTIGLGLSGGLDSRAILSAIESPAQVRAFTLFDEENDEFKTATEIAKACGVKLTSIRRDPEHYGSWAGSGVRISGATGCIRSNHYLAARKHLQELGIQNLLTGCYCDYIFKGLALNTSESKFLRIQQLNGFNIEHYLPHYWPNTAEQKNVRDRLSQNFPGNHTRLDEAEWLAVEQRRAFPFAYEGDSAMRLIPLRVIPWYLPIADNDLLAAYLRIPPRYKLNSSIFRKMLGRICSPAVLGIPDNNTGARVLAGTLERAGHRYRTALQNRIEKRLRPRIAERGSWPNWEFYVHHSPVVAQTWSNPGEETRGIFSAILGEDPFVRPITSYRGRTVELFSRIWTLKLWMEQRCGAN